jgi:hypothetical protein
MLPTTKTNPVISLDRMTTLVYGQPKIGKSTLCSEFPGAIFLATEPGLNALSTYQVDVTSWKVLLDAAVELASGKHQFETIIIDTIDNAYKMCSDYICEQNKIKHESDLGFGKGWKMVENEFHRVLTKLAKLPYGLVMVSHSKIVEVENNVAKYNKIVPSLPDKARAIALGLADLILYADIEYSKLPDGERLESRVLRTKPTKFFEAGDRTGMLPDSLSLSYNALSNAMKGQ